MDPTDTVGASVYLPSFNKAIKHKLPAETSIFLAEAWAILQAINLITDMDWKETIIFSDSFSVISALMDDKGGSNSNNYLIIWIRIKLYQASSKNTNIILFWTPAHKGIPGNERAD